MRDSMRGRTDHSPRPTLSEDPTLDSDNVPLAFFGTVAARSGPYPSIHSHNLQFAHAS